MKFDEFCIPSLDRNLVTSRQAMDDAAGEHGKWLATSAACS